MIKFSIDNTHIKTAQAWMWNQPCLPEEEALIKEVTDKRKKEFRAGRHCLQTLLQKQDCFHFPIKRNQHRQPLLPDDFCGSISHKNSLAIAVLARKSHFINLGIDIERHATIQPKIWDKIFTYEEITHLNKQTNPELSASILFSAKESSFKLLSVFYHENPEKNKSITNLKELTIDLDYQEGIFALNKASQHPIFTGQYIIKNSYVYTLAYLPYSQNQI